MKECSPTTEGDAKIKKMRAAEKAFHEKWCDALHQLTKQLNALAPQILLAQLQGKDPLTDMISTLPQRAEAEAHREALRLACVRAKVCYRCGDKALPNVTPSMCEAAYNEGD